MSAALLRSATCIMSQPDMYTSIAVAILFVIGLGLGIVKLLRKRRRKMQTRLGNDYWDSYEKYTRPQLGRIGLAMVTGVLLGVAATLFTAYSANGTGIIQISLLHQAHTLDVRPATPQIGTSMRIQEQQMAFPPFYYLTTSIYNEGDLAAEQLSGHWRLFSPDNSVKKCEVPIERDFLLSTPYQLEPCLLQGTTVFAAMRGESKIRFQVDIEFDYFGSSNDQPQHYSAKYQYDPRSRQIVKVS